MSPRPGPDDPDRAIRVVFLGGLGEVGRNMACVELEGRILLIDVGLSFPNADMPGVDLVLPDFEYLRDRADDIEAVVLTHGHEDHIADAVKIARDTGAHAVAPYELSVWLQKKGIKNVTGMNPGGTLEMLGLSITMVPAVHSSSIEEDGRIVYLGLATGYVVRFENGTTIYFAGDTSLFGDMRLIGTG